MTNKCFKKCITKPGTSLSNSEHVSLNLLVTDLKRDICIIVHYSANSNKIKMENGKLTLNGEQNLVFIYIITNLLIILPR